MTQTVLVANEIARQALAHWGLHGARLTRLPSANSLAFKVELEHRVWHLCLREPLDRPHLAAEAAYAWTRDLSDAALPVARPIATHTRDLVVRLNAGGPLERTAILSAWLEGEIKPTDERSLMDTRAVGVLLGRIHRHSLSWRGGMWLPWRAHNINITMPMARIRQTNGLRQDLTYARSRLRIVEDALHRLPRSYGAIHTDPSFGNVLFGANGPQLVDFHEATEGFYAYDLAVVLAGYYGKPDYAAHRHAFLEAYQSLRPLMRMELDAIPAMMAARAASLLLWAQERSPDHPWIPDQRQRMNALVAEIPL